MIRSEVNDRQTGATYPTRWASVMGMGYFSFGLLEMAFNLAAERRQRTR